MEATKELTLMEGTVESVIFRNEENGYTVLRLSVGDGEPVTVVGCMPGAAPGEGLGTEADSPLPVLEPVFAYQVILPEGCDPHTALGKLRQNGSRPSMRDWATSLRSRGRPGERTGMSTCSSDVSKRGGWKSVE